eukprot:gene12282-25833_t
MSSIRDAKRQKRGAVNDISKNHAPDSFLLGDSEMSSQQADNSVVLASSDTNSPFTHDENIATENSVPVSDIYPEISVVDSINKWGLHDILADNLIKDGINSFFPVQRLVLPKLLRSVSSPYIYPRDICVSAPTGSGKTLSYVLPILQSILNQPTPHLTALIILPSRELATQVYSVFKNISKGTNIKICCATGQTSFEIEQSQLMGTVINESQNNRMNSLFSNESLYQLDNYSKYPTNVCISGASILVCTPGRLLEHLQKTAGFSMKYIRFLILDEADKLLGNAYHHWVRAVIQSAHDTSAQTVGCSLSTSLPSNSNEEMTFLRKRKMSRESSLELDCQNPSLLSLFTAQSQPLQRLLFSATLTDNPRKLALLGIRNPLVLRASATYTGHGESEGGQDRNTDTAATAASTTAAVAGTLSSLYTLPTQLTEAVCVSDTSRRPLLLAALLAEAIGISRSHVGSCFEEGQMCIVFASSVDSTHRLCRLLQAINGQINDTDLSTSNSTDEPSQSSSQSQSWLYGGRVVEMSRLLRPEQRDVVMRDAAAGNIKILVSSDHMARGIDLSNIRLVINYDPPSHVRTYVHRVGRTARANKSGHCITMLKIGQVGVFKKLRKQIDGLEGIGQELCKCKVSKETEEAFGSIYKKGLKQLSKILELEESGDLLNITKKSFDLTCKLQHVKGFFRFIE